MGLDQFIEVRLRDSNDSAFFIRFRNIYSIQFYFDKLCPNSWIADVTREDIKEILSILKNIIISIYSSKDISFDGYYTNLIDSENGFVSFTRVRDFKRLYAELQKLYDSFLEYGDVFYMGG